MRDFPTDPMRQHNLLIAAFCDDLFDMCMNGKSGTPRSDAVCEISRQLARQDRANKRGWLIISSGAIHCER